jgi:hypothetical protein
MQQMPTDFAGSMYGMNFTTQPHQQDPWNGEGPPRSIMIPDAGSVMFDPATDTGTGNYYPNNVDSWAWNNTYPPSLLSPSEPMAPPQDSIFPLQSPGFPYQSNGYMTHSQATVPVEAHLITSPTSTSPNFGEFINFNASSRLITDTYTTPDQHVPVSPTESSLVNYLQSPVQPAGSPFVSAGSPGGSDGMVSYQHSDVDMTFDQAPAPALEQHVPQSQALIHGSASPTGVTEMSFDASPEPEQSQSGSATKGSNKSGGRALGTHLEPKVAKAAHDMRKIVACWHCVLQRDKCGPGDTCERCLKRSQRPNADCGLGCSRIKLVDLSSSFIPDLITQMHEDSHLTNFVSQHIHQWHNVELTVMMTCGQKSMPRIPVKVYEFVPKGSALLVQIQYRTDPGTSKRVAYQKQSPPLGMVQINHNEEKKYDKYINDIVENHLDAFGELCWMEDDNDFQQKLHRLISRVKPKGDDEAKLFHEVQRLIVVTFIMSHTLTMAEESKYATLSRMHSYSGHNDTYTSPRMTNRQLKYFFSKLRRTIQNNLLNKLQQIFKSSKGCDKWLAAFVAIVGMCMALEDQQKTIHLVQTTKSSTENVDVRDAQMHAENACREIDVRMHFIQQIFRWKYNRKCNPLLNSEHDWANEVGFGDASSVHFVRQVAQLVRENSESTVSCNVSMRHANRPSADYLQHRRAVSISSANQTQYTSRLVGQFLLSFWMP